MLYREIIAENYRVQANWYHVSDDPDLNLQAGFHPRQGQLGRGFYVSADRRIWRDSLGKRRYTYKVINPQEFRISPDRPNLNDQQFIDWALAKGYMEIRPVMRPDGREVLGLDDKPMHRPDFTEEGQKFLWQDPMTGSKTQDIENEYLKDHGFDGYEPVYSRDGHQIILFDPTKVRLRKLNR